MALSNFVIFLSGVDDVSLQVLVSTMQQKDFSLLERMCIRSDAIVINQSDHNEIHHFNHDDHQILWITCDQRGLSRSRNLALRKATAEICLVADDDLVYLDGYDQMVLDAFEKFPKADIITFQVVGIERLFKQYAKYPRRLRYLTSMKVSSVEIAFRTERIRQAGISFNDRFGAGSKYRMGEENIFLFECLRNGLKIQYVPLALAKLHIGGSSWFEGYTSRYFRDLGAAYTAMSRLGSYALIFQFALRKYSLYKESVGFATAIKYMFGGRKEYLMEFGDSG